LPNEPQWLSAADIAKLNRLIVASTDEPHHLRDRGLLEGALASPRNHWGFGEGSLGRLAGRLLIAIARDHPFEQGNKRTALYAADAFLFANGWELRASDDSLAERILDLIDHRMSEEDFLRYLALVVRRSRPG
jgi:death-on-curing protein